MLFSLFCQTTSGRNSGVPSFNPVDIDIAHNITKKNANLMPYVYRIKKETYNFMRRSMNHLYDFADEVNRMKSDGELRQGNADLLGP